MKKLIYIATVLTGLQAAASANIVTVACNTPSMMAGTSIRMAGKLEIVVSPTTGMTKLKMGSQLTITKSMRSGAKKFSVQENIVVSGTYYSTSSSVKIEANQEPSSSQVDDRTYSEITIDGKNSSIYEIKGNKNQPLVCIVSK